MKFLASVCITLTVVWTSAIQKSFADVIQNKKPLRIRKVHMKTTVSASLFNKCVDLKACNFIKKRIQHRYFPVIFAKFLRTTFLIEHIQWLLLEISYELALYCI